MIDCGANFSDCRSYRYSLWRYWDRKKAAANFIMLNPSTADEYVNDPSVERCQRRAAGLGYGGLIVTNLFAFRSTDPKGLRSVDDPIGGPENDQTILESAKNCALVVCAWGNHGSYRERDQHVVALLLQNRIALHALGLTKRSLVPRHPLYISYETQIQLWQPTQQKGQQ